MKIWTILLMLTAMTVMAQETAKKEPAKKEQAKKEAVKKQATAAGGAGMVVTLNPSRSEADPNAPLSDEMRDALSRLVNTSSEGLVEEQREDGTVVVDLQGRFQSAMVAKIGPDGKLETTCVSKDPEHQHLKACNVTDDKKKDQ